MKCLISFKGECDGCRSCQVGEIPQKTNKPAEYVKEGDKNYGHDLLDYEIEVIETSSPIRRIDSKRPFYWGGIIDDNEGHIIIGDKVIPYLNCLDEEQLSDIYGVTFWGDDL